VIAHGGSGVPPLIASSQRRDAAATLIRVDLTPAPSRIGAMPSKPIPGSTGEVLTCLAVALSAARRHGVALPAALPGQVQIREGARCAAGELCEEISSAASTGFLCQHLGVDPNAVEQLVRESADDAEIERRLRALLPQDVRAARWNRDLVQKGMTPAGRSSSRRR